MLQWLWGPDLSLDENLLRLATRLPVASDSIVARHILGHLNGQSIESERNVVLRTHFDSFCHLFFLLTSLCQHLLTQLSKALLARFNTIKVANYTAGRCSSMMCRPPRQINGSHVEIEVIGFGINAWLGLRNISEPGTSTRNQWANMGKIWGTYEDGFLMKLGFSLISSSTEMGLRKYQM